MSSFAVTITFPSPGPTALALLSLLRTDTQAVITGDGAITGSGTTWTLAITEPAAGLSYTYSLQGTWADGSTSAPFGATVASPAAANAGVTYLSLADALALRATLPSLALRFWDAAGSDDQTAALVQGTWDIDHAIVYQGRRCKPAALQPNQFPRVAYEASGFPQGGFEPGGGWGYDGCSPDGGMPLAGYEVWDWDPVNKVAIVPQAVLIALLYQADFVLGYSEELLDRQHGGLKSQQAAGVGESYADRADNPGLTTGLCRRAWVLLHRYRLVTGRIL